MSEQPSPQQLQTESGLEVILRPAESSDAAQMRQNVAAVGAEKTFIATEEPPWTSSELRELVENAQGWSLIFVAQVNDRVVGDCWMMRGRREKTKHRCQLGMHLIRGYRGQGLGSAMVEYGLEWARDNGLLKVALSVFETNRRAVALYEKFGFAREGRRPAQYVIQGQPVAEIPMGLVLGSQATGC